MPLTKNSLTRKNTRKKGDLIRVMTGSKKWWQSKTIHGLAVVAIGIAAKRFGWHLGDADAAKLVADLAEVIGLGYAWFGRISAKEKLTK